jgi:hypothetical protein
MKSTKLLLPCFFLTVHSLFGQISNVIIKYDSSFTLTKQLHQDKLDIGQHGVFFNEKTKQVIGDFRTIETLSLTDLSKYQKQVIQEDDHLIKIWTAKAPSENVSTIIEINSVYPIDTTDEDQKVKDTIIYNDYFFQLKDSAKNVHYQTIDRQGVSKYSIGNKQVFVSREMILIGLLYIDNTDKIKRLLSKYNYAQQVHL